MSRKLHAEIITNPDGSFSVLFEDIEDGRRSFGHFDHKRKAERLAKINGYKVVETLLQPQCGG